MTTSKNCSKIKATSKYRSKKSTGHDRRERKNMIERLNAMMKSLLKMKNEIANFSEKQLTNLNTFKDIQILGKSYDVEESLDNAIITIKRLQAVIKEKQINE